MQGTGRALKRAYRLTANIERFRPGRDFSDAVADFHFTASFPEELLELFSEQGVQERCTLRRDPVAALSETVMLKGDVYTAEFECGPFDCATLLSKDPRVVIEMVSLTPSGARVMGVASIALGGLIDVGALETWTSVFRMSEIGSSQSENAEIGEVLFKAKLEDLGVKRRCHVSNVASGAALHQQPCKKSTEVSPRELYVWLCCLEEGSDVETDRPSHSRDVQQFAEKEMELWKKEEMEKHRRHLHDLEFEKMEFLEHEWRRHEQIREREITELKSRLETHTQKALLLRSALRNAEERERKVTVLQESLLRRRKDLEKQHVAKLQEYEDAIHRLQIDFEHHLGLEREKITEAATKTTQLKQSLKSSEERVAQLESESVQLKKSNMQTSVMMLEQELEGFKKVNAAAQQRITVLEKEKERYKAKVVELAENVGALQAALERALERPIADDAKPQRLLDTEKAQLTVEAYEAIKKELQELKFREQERACGRFPDRTVQPVVNEDEKNAAQIECILQNKKELLETGVYAANDALILELDERIRQLSLQT